MAAMMPGVGSGHNNDASNPYDYDAPVLEDDLIDPDDGKPENRSIVHRKYSSLR